MGHVMARAVRNTKIDTRSARLKLLARREPYWSVISTGCAVGYRRGAKGGTWIARFRHDDGKQQYESLGAADDARDADGLTALSFQQAQEKARDWFKRTAREAAGEMAPRESPYTVADALTDYFAAQVRKGAKSPSKAISASNSRIVPELGEVQVAKLTATRLRRWHEDVAAKPKLVRTKAGSTERQTKALDANDPDVVRARRATANRLLTIVKAALNLAFRDGLAVADEAWRKVKPFREVDDPVVRYLTAAECKRFVNASTPDFRNLVRGALLTGCRYGELCRLAANDVNLDVGTLAVRISKAGKVRHVTLTEEAQAFFANLGAAKSGRDLLFTRENGEPWKASQQARPAEEASKHAKIDPPVTFHTLRHTHASMLAMAGAPMGVIAAQLGHADTRVTERHYAHLAPSYVADTIRAHLPSLGITDTANVRPMKKAK